MARTILMSSSVVKPSHKLVEFHYKGEKGIGHTGCSSPEDARDIDDGQMHLLERLLA